MMAEPSELPTLPASSDDGELTDSDEEIAGKAKATTITKDDGEQQLLTLPPQLPVIAAIAATEE